MQEANQGINPITPYPMNVNSLQPPYQSQYVTDGSTQWQLVQPTSDAGFNYNMNMNTTCPQFPNELSSMDVIQNMYYKHNQEIDTYWTSQGTSLMNNARQLLHRQHMYNYNYMMGITQKLQATEVEKMNMGKMNTELEERIKQLTTESQGWQAKAEHNKALFAALKNRLEESLIINIDLKEEGISGGENNETVSASNKGLGSCIKCGNGEMCVLMLPCRHLCLCEKCDNYEVKSCPVCGVIKNRSIIVLKP